MNRLSRTSHMEVVDRLYVSRGKYIILVRTGEKAFLIGVTNQTMVMLGEVDDAELAALQQQAGAPRTDKKPFMDKLKGFLSNTVSAPEALRKARAEAKGGSAAARGEEGKAGNDDFAKIMESIEARKQRYGQDKGRGGDGL